MNKNLTYYDVIMRREMIDSIFVPSLPQGYRFKNYEENDEQYWVDLEYEVGEFSCREDALAYFNRVFKPHSEALKKRMFFILDEQNRYVATASAWFKQDENRYYSVLHWISVSPTQQGKGLGKIIVSYALSHFPALDPNEKEIFLHTQTWSYKAIALYYKLGFKITQIPLLQSYSDMRCIDVLKEVLPSSFVEQLIE